MTMNSSVGVGQAPQPIPIESITFEPLIYPREIKDSYGGEPFWYHVDRYLKALMVGHKMPPIVVANLDGKTVLIDGYHRMLAYKRLKRTEIEATFIDVRDWNEAFLESVARNVIHGAPLGKWEMVRAANNLISKSGYSAEEISFAVATPTLELNKQIQERLFIDPTSNEKIIVKRPFVAQNVKHELPAEFNNTAQSPFNTEYQTQVIDQVNALLENHLMDTASKKVRDGLNRLNKNLRDLMSKR